MVEAKKYDLDLIFQALSDPSRRAMLKSISSGEKTVTEMAEPFRNLSIAAVSKHIKVLERAQLVHRRKQGSYQYVRINAEAIRSADEWIEFYKKFWNKKIHSLKNLLEGEEP